MDKELINTVIILSLLSIVGGVISGLSEYNHIEGLFLGLCGLFIALSIYCILKGINELNK